MQPKEALVVLAPQLFNGQNYCILFKKKISVFELFHDYGQRQEKLTLPGDVKQLTWFKIYLFSKNTTDLFEMLKFLNSLLIRHTLFGYEEFSASIVNSILP